MRAALIPILLSVLPAFAGSPAAEDPFKGIDCKNAKVQMELNYCADRDFQAADKKLNAVYRKLLDSDDPKDKGLPKTAERNWIAWRDSECAYETAGSEGGSIQPMEYSECLTQKTEARIKELQQ
ncbi:MAG TPA: lysozyme inhibitor LprI family protein [Rhizomicrobium sp.]|nr:lysozyme inhibitor LprI family protein [Rhizomicrobium sp.]